MSDKYGDATATLTPEVLQKAICEGKDLFNAVPEAYSVCPIAENIVIFSNYFNNSIKTCFSYGTQNREYSVLLRMDSVPINFTRSKSAVGIPKWIIVEASRYRHLLPGGCKRSMVENKKLEDS